MTQAQSTTRSPDQEEAIKYVLLSAHEHDVKFIRLWFTDILGMLKGFAITVDELEDVLRFGASFDGASMQGLARADESDMVAMPDPTTWQILPWRPRENSVARLFCDLRTVSGAPAETDSREVLRRQLRRTAELGYTFYVAPEIEYYFIEDMEREKKAHRRTRRGFGAPPLSDPRRRSDNYFDQSSYQEGADLRRRTVLALEDLGIPVKHSHHEVSEGQHEIDLRHTDALTMADSVITFRVVVKELASQMGGYATFMPRPFNHLNGSGMHTHMSLSSGDTNAFYDEEKPSKLSTVAEQFIAGLIRHSSEITAVTNQWVNSYKRLVEGTEAPVFAAWTTGHYANLVRVPAYREGKDASVRAEYRAADSACNPYLAFAVLLAAGLEGIENKYELPAAIPGDPFKMTRKERSELGLTALPSSLDEALRIADKSELLEKALGPVVLENFLENKRIEWSDYASTVTDYERARYFNML